MEENSIFEISDFTIVTDMEHFGAAFEGILQKRNLCGKRPNSKNGKNEVVNTESTVLSIGETKLRIEVFETLSSNTNPVEVLDDQLSNENENFLFFNVVEEIKNTSGCFTTKHKISKNFGVRNYIMVTPENESSALTDESQVNTLMGTIKTILHLNGCELPVFCSVKNQEHNLIHGYANNGNESLKFSSVVLHNINRRHCFMNDLLILFKENLGASCSAFHDEVKISSRFTSVVSLGTSKICRLITEDNFRRLATGPFFYQPFDCIQIEATWRFFSENSLTENHSHTDFDINFASHWNVAFKLSSNNMAGVFDEILEVYTNRRRKLIRSNISCGAILGKNYTPRNLPNAFQKLTSSSVREVQIATENNLNQEKTCGPLSDKMIEAWLCFIFNEKIEEPTCFDEINSLIISQAQELNKWESDTFEDSHYFPEPEEPDSFLVPYKCARKKTTAWRVAIALANIRVYFGSEARAEPQLWIEFLIRLRKKYDNMEKIEDLKNGLDNSQCAFSQKLQILQLCVEARQKRHRLFDGAHSSYSEDTFFDANDTFNESMEATANKSLGRLRKTSLKLIGDPSVPLFIPITQDPCPLTEEMMDIHNEKLFSMDETGRVDSQMELVRSDMQSFKAANPNAVFADFLRWHSPKDIDENTGKISERMLIPNNIWLRHWETAEAIPVINQTRIFNDTKIAEEIFERFENATLDKVREWIKPTVFAATFERLAEIENLCDVSENKKEQRLEMAKSLAQATLNNSSSDYAKLIDYCCQMEMIYNMRVYLGHLFKEAVNSMQPPQPPQNEIHSAISTLINIAVSELWNTPSSPSLEFRIKPQEPIGRALAIIGKLKMAPEKQLKNVNRKEYIFTWNLNCPSVTTAPMVHRMYADLKQDKHCLHFSSSNDLNVFNSSYL